MDLDTWVAEQNNEEYSYLYAEYKEDSKEKYEGIIKAIQKYNLTIAYDIGCGQGFQGVMFKEQGIGYAGIDIEKPLQQIPLEESFVSYGNYPFNTKWTNATTVAISVLCMGYLVDAWRYLAYNFPYYMTPDGLADEEYFDLLEITESGIYVYKSKVWKQKILPTMDNIHKQPLPADKIAQYKAMHQ